MRTMRTNIKMRRMFDFNMSYTWNKHGSSLPSGKLFV